MGKVGKQATQGFIWGQFDKCWYYSLARKVTDLHFDDDFGSIRSLKSQRDVLRGTPAEMNDAGVIREGLNEENSILGLHTQSNILSKTLKQAKHKLPKQNCCTKSRL